MSLLLWFFLCLLLFSHMINWSIDFLIFYFLGFIKIPVCMNQCLSWLLENSQSALTCQIWLLNNFLSPYLLKLRHMLDYLTLFFISLNYSFTCSISLVLQAAFYYFLRFFFQFTIVAHVVKNPPTMQETGIQSLDQKDPLEKGMAIHSSILARRIPWTEEPGRLQSMGSPRVGHDWVTDTWLDNSLCWSAVIIFISKIFFFFP